MQDVNMIADRNATKVAAINPHSVRRLCFNAGLRILSVGGQMDFYESQKWKDKRARILRRDAYQCQVSKRYGRLVPAELVHHIFPLDEFPEFAFADWNLISVSQRIHNKLHDRQSNELTEEGRLLLERTARKNNIEVPEKYKHPVKRKGYHGRSATI